LKQEGNLEAARKMWFSVCNSLEKLPADAAVEPYVDTTVIALLAYIDNCITNCIASATVMPEAGKG
jgi:hypothetical protein